jgi:hypothetical protein
MMKKLLITAVVLLAPFAVGCSSACDDLADELEKCCEDAGITCDQQLLRDEGDSDACQSVLDQGDLCPGV